MHDLSAGPGAARQRANCQGVKHGAVARAYDHGVGGVKFILRGKRFEIGYVFQIAAAERASKRKSPEGFTGKADHHGIDIFFGERIHENKFLRRPRFGKLVDRCRNIGTFVNSSDGIWWSRRGPGLLGDIRIRGRIRCGSRFRFNHPQNCGTNQNCDSSDAPDLDHAARIEAA